MNIFAVMKKMLLAVCLFMYGYAFSQPSFIDAQKTFPNVALALKSKQDTLQKQFAAAGLQWPPKQIYIRSFKYDSQMEVWVRSSTSENFKLFKTYRICALAGALGPKRMAGDYQVPEGFYYITEFNPKIYHLALKLNYPNESDKVLSDSSHPGGGIYIHGSCVTVGCIPINDSQIEELYLLAAAAKNNGQDFIPVHIFPVRYGNQQSMDYLTRAAKDNIPMQKFAVKLKEVYDYFDKEKQLPIIAVNKKGEYIIM
jgi:murein L,D-transpeptidase YafK